MPEPYRRFIVLVLGGLASSSTYFKAYYALLCTLSKCGYSKNITNLNVAIARVIHSLGAFAA